MKTLIVEDDFTSRLLMQELLKSDGPSHPSLSFMSMLHSFHP